MKNILFPTLTNSFPSAFDLLRCRLLRIEIIYGAFLMLNTSVCSWGCKAFVFLSFGPNADGVRTRRKGTNFAIMCKITYDYWDFVEKINEKGFPRWNSRKCFFFILKKWFCRHRRREKENERNEKLLRIKTSLHPAWENYRLIIYHFKSRCCCFLFFGREGSFWSIKDLSLWQSEAFNLITRCNSQRN